MTRLQKLSERIIAYLTEQAIMVALTTSFDTALGVKSVLLDFFVLYKSNFNQAIITIFETKNGWIDIMILTLISFLYYTSETALNAGISTTVFRKRIISRFERGNEEFR